MISTFANMIGGSSNSVEQDKINKELEEIKKMENTKYIDSLAKNIHIGEVSKKSKVKEKETQENGKSKKANSKDKQKQPTMKNEKNNKEKERDDESR